MAEKQSIVDKALSAISLAAVTVAATKAARDQPVEPKEPQLVLTDAEHRGRTTGYLKESDEPSDLVAKIDAFQKNSAPAGFMWAVVKKFGEDKAGHLAALVAYFGFFSIFPLLIAMVSTLGFALDGNDELRKEVSDAAFSQIPIVGNTLKNTITDVDGSGVFLIVGIVASLWAGLKIVDATQNAMNDVWDLPKAEKVPFLIKRAKGLLTLLLLFVGLVGGLAVSTVASHVPAIPGAGQFAIAAGTILVNIGLYILLFRIMTAEKLPWKAHFTGGALAGICWWIMQTFGVVYLSRVEENAGPTYGSFASTIVLLTFIFISAQLIILCAEIGIVRYRGLWPRALPKCEITDADRRTWELQAKSARQVPAQQITSSI